MASGLDSSRLDDGAYVESLSRISEQVSAVKATVLSEGIDVSDVVDFGSAPGSAQMIVY